MLNLKFRGNGFENYVSWQTEDKKTLKKINKLIYSMRRTPYSGLGKPEPLKENLSGLWSRRIDDYNRIVYSVENDDIVIISCKTHYEK